MDPNKPKDTGARKKMRRKSEPQNVRKEPATTSPIKIDAEDWIDSYLSSPRFEGNMDEISSMMKPISGFQMKSNMSRITKVRKNNQPKIHKTPETQIAKKKLTTISTLEGGTLSTEMSKSSLVSTLTQPTLEKSVQRAFFLLIYYICYQHNIENRREGRKLFKNVYPAFFDCLNLSITNNFARNIDFKKYESIFDAIINPNLMKDQNKELTLPSPIIEKRLLSETHYLVGSTDHNFIYLEKIGFGAYGYVVKAFHKVDEKEYAIKKIPLKCTSRDVHSKVCKEAKTLASLGHENIVRYYTSWIALGNILIDDKLKGCSNSQSLRHLIASHTELTMRTTSSSIEFRSSFKNTVSVEENIADELVAKKETCKKSNTEFRKNISHGLNGENYDRSDVKSALVPFSAEINKNEEEVLMLHIQMELCKQNLKDWIILQKDQEVNDKKNKDIFKQILKAVEYIHSEGIVHSDLKPANIFINDGIIKVGDFGLARDLNFCQINKGEGTSFYNAPQDKGKAISPKSDIYSLGVILYELYVHFNTGSERCCHLTELQKNTNIAVDTCKKWPNQMKFVKKMISKSSSRPEASEMLHSEMFYEKDEMITKLQEEIRNKETALGKCHWKIASLKREVKSLNSVISDKDLNIFMLKCRMALDRD